MPAFNEISVKKIIAEFVNTNTPGPDDVIVLSRFTMDSDGASEGVELWIYKDFGGSVEKLHAMMKGFDDNCYEDVTCQIDDRKLEIFETDAKSPMGLELQLVKQSNSNQIMTLSCRSYVDDWQGPH